jgi:hypothetical protein
LSGAEHGALGQALLAGDEPARVAGGAARERAIALTEHALGWLRADISAPACPDHGR